MAFTRSAHALASNVRGLQRSLRALGQCRGFRAWLVDAEKGHLKSREAGEMNCWHAYRCPLATQHFDRRLSWSILPPIFVYVCIVSGCFFVFADVYRMVACLHNNDYCQFMVAMLRLGESLAVKCCQIGEKLWRHIVTAAARSSSNSDSQGEVQWFVPWLTQSARGPHAVRFLRFRPWVCKRRLRKHKSSEGLNERNSCQLWRLVTKRSKKTQQGGWWPQQYCRIVHQIWYCTYYVMYMY